MTENKKVSIIVRTYHKDKQILIDNLISTLNIFVNRNLFKFVVVLDEESKEDHFLGEYLLKNDYVDSVIFEKLPNDWKDLFKGISFESPRNRWGYDRQQWSTFYMDKHSEDDIIGVVDSDSTFFTYITKENIFTNDGRVIVNAYLITPENVKKANPLFRKCEIKNILKYGNAYINDKVALKEESPYECMLTNRMPMWFWRSTYENCRKHIEKKWGIPFDEAFKIFSRKKYSQFNILLNYVVKYEPERYNLRVLNLNENDIVTVCQNGCENKKDILIGGIRSFKIKINEIDLKIPESDFKKFEKDTAHLNRRSYKLWGSKAGINYADKHYANVHNEILRLTPQEREKKYKAFREFNFLVSSDNLEDLK